MDGVMYVGLIEDNLCPTSVDGFICKKPGTTDRAQLSGTFKKQVRNATIRLVMSVYLHEKTRLRSEEFSLHTTFRNFINICQNSEFA